jgi:hypothetical protein
MARDRTRQLRLERKRRRRHERRRRQIAGTRPTGDAATWKKVFVPAGHAHDEHVLAQATALHATAMSDSLTTLIEPYVSSPLRADELEDVIWWLDLAAAVWNVTVREHDDARLVDALARLAVEVDDDDPLALVTEIARRKLMMFPSDRREVIGVRVHAESGMAHIEAASVAHVRRSDAAARTPVALR